MSWFDKNDRTSSSHFDGVQLPSRAPPSLCFLPSPVRQQDAGSCAIESARSAAGASGARQVGQPSGGAAAGTTVAAQGPGGAGGGAARPGRPPRRRGLAGRAEGRRRSFERCEVDPGRCGGGAAGARGARRRGGRERVGAPVEQELLPRARAELRGGRRTRSSTAGGVRRARAELGGWQGAAKPATAAGSGCAGCRGSRRGGEEEDQCMICGSHQTGANGIRSLLMLILPTKQKMEPLHPSNQT